MSQIIASIARLDAARTEHGAIEAIKAGYVATAMRQIEASSAACRITQMRLHASALERAAEDIRARMLAPQPLSERE